MRRWARSSTTPSTCGGSGSPAASDDPAADLGEFEEEVVRRCRTRIRRSAAARQSIDAGRLVQRRRRSRRSGWRTSSRRCSPGSRPLAAVIHLVSPHFPWRHLPDGRTYAAPAEGADLPINGGNGGVPWIQDLERQRHLLQAMLHGRLGGPDPRPARGGRPLRRRRRGGHGRPRHGVPRRREPPAADPRGAPGDHVDAADREGARADRSRGSTTRTWRRIDIVPTIADLIGVDIPWEVDGLAAGSDAQLARDDQKLFRRITNNADPDPSHDVEVDGAAGFADMLELAFPSLGPDDDPLAGALRAVGTRRAGRAAVRADRRDLAATRSRSMTSTGCRSEEQLVVVLTGTVAGGRVDEDAVVAVVDDRIVAVSPVVFRNIGGSAFALLLPLDGSAALGSGPPCPPARRRAARRRPAVRLTAWSPGAPVLSAPCRRKREGAS